MGQTRSLIHPLIFQLPVSAFLAFLAVSCKTAPPQPVEVVPLHGPEYKIGIEHGKQIATGSEKDYELIIFIHENVTGDATKEGDFREGFIAGYIESKPGQESEARKAAEEAAQLAMNAAVSPEYRNGLETAAKVKKGKISDATARTTIKAARSLAGELALKSGFIKGYAEGGEAMYYALIR